MLTTLKQLGLALRPPDVLQILTHRASPRLLWYASTPPSLGVPLRGHTCGVVWRLPQSMANPFPLPALYCGFYIPLSCTWSQLFIRDDIWPEDTEYLPEPLIQKGLYLGKQSFCFPEYKMFSPVLVHNDPKVIHLISLTPRMLRLYRFISFTVWAHLPCWHMVPTFHVPSLTRDFGESNFIRAAHFIPCLAPRCIGLMGIVPSLSAPEGASSQGHPTRKM